MRGTTADVDYAALNATVAAGEPGLTAAANTTYTINNGDVQADKAGIALLFDAIINTTDNDRTAQLEDRADKALGGADADRQYEIRYLDLVDRNNGNAWVKASENVTVSWPLPAGTDADTDFTLLHFKDLHRDMESGVIEDNIETAKWKRWTARSKMVMWSLRSAAAASRHLLSFGMKKQTNRIRRTNQMFQLNQTYRKISTPLTISRTSLAMKTAR